MREKPIIFSGPMVRAILSGRKTQTRLVIKDARPSWEKAARTYDSVVLATGVSFIEYPMRWIKGDHLWVREAWRAGLDLDMVKPSMLAETSPILHEENAEGVLKSEYGKLRPSISMPKWAARIWLKVKSVRAERLQDITEADAEDEGCLIVFRRGDEADYWYSFDGKKFEPDYAVNAFKDFWDSKNTKCGYGWETNPWVAVYEFERIEK